MKYNENVVHATQQTWYVGPTLFYCWLTIYDVGPTLHQRWAGVSCFLRTYIMEALYYITMYMADFFS